MSTFKHHGRVQQTLILLALAAAFAFGATARTASADHYHVNCVGHGFVHGGADSDGSFHSRVETGCSSTYRTCEIWSSGTYRGGDTTPDSGTTCNAWSNAFGSYAECASYAQVYSSGVFSEHNHLAHNWCG